MTPYVRLVVPALVLALVAGAAQAATVTVDFAAELIGQRDARYITRYDRHGDPRFRKVGGLFSDFDVGDVLSGQIELSGNAADFAALLGTGKASSFSSDLAADCTIGPVACEATEYSIRAGQPLLMRATFYADFGDTSFDFVLGRRGDRLKVVQILGSHGGLQDGERDYLARFALSDFDLAAAARTALPVVPVGPAAPLLAGALLALGLLRRRV